MVKRTTPIPTMRVQAAPDRVVVFPLDVVAGPGGRHRFLEGDEIIEVPSNARFVARRILMHDLIVVPLPKVEKPAEKKEVAK